MLKVLCRWFDLIRELKWVFCVFVWRVKYKCVVLLVGLNNLFVIWRLFNFCSCDLWVILVWRWILKCVRVRVSKIMFNVKVVNFRCFWIGDFFVLFKYNIKLLLILMKVIKRRILEIFWSVLVRKRIRDIVSLKYFVFVILLVMLLNF